MVTGYCRPSPTLFSPFIFDRRASWCKMCTKQPTHTHTKWKHNNLNKVIPATSIHSYSFRIFPVFLFIETISVIIELKLLLCVAWGRVARRIFSFSSFFDTTLKQNGILLHWSGWTPILSIGARLRLWKEKNLNFFNLILIKMLVNFSELWENVFNINRNVERKKREMVLLVFYRKYSEYIAFWLPSSNGAMQYWIKQFIKRFFFSFSCRPKYGACSLRYYGKVCEIYKRAQM